MQLVGWCLGGIMSLLAVAGHTQLDVRSVALIASPFDFTRVRMMQPIRQLAELTEGRIVTALYRALGGAPAPLVSLAFQATALDKRVTKPLTMLRNLHDRDLLAHIEAVDDYMANMLAYPGPHVRPALPPLLPGQRAGRGQADVRRRALHRPGRREACRC